MRKFLLGLALMLTAFSIAVYASAQEQKPQMSFFVTSVGTGNGANLGGLAGADAFCQKLAAAAGAGNRTWHAYLSTSASDGKPAVNAHDRIGNGPWYNAKGEKIADNLADLHADENNISDKNHIRRETALDEKGNRVNGHGDKPNKHDILTGSKYDGTAYPPGEDMTCSNWTAGNSTKLPGKAQLGHHDRHGLTPTSGLSWNSAHASRGCGREDLISSGGAGLFYCFAVK
jgi:hypothetical protein